MEAEFFTSVAKTVGKLITEYASLYVSYFFCFGKIVEEFKNQRKELEWKKDRVKNDVDEATRQTEVIEKDVLNWLESAEKELEETQSWEVEIERMCFSCCPNWGWRYCLSKKVAKKTLYINKLLERSNFQRMGYRAPLQGLEFLPSKDFMTSESSNSAFNEIIKALNTANVNMIGLYGMPGVGKTTLAKEVGKHAKEQKLSFFFGQQEQKLFEYVVMVTMSQTLDISKIRDRIAELLGLKFAESTTEEGKAERLWCRLKGVKKILIIIDDVWNEFKLKTIGIPFGAEHDGCKILLTTRRQQVCDQMNCQKKFQLDILSEDEAWALFKDNAGLENVPSRLNDVAKEVACECKGLPLAIVTVGKALKGASLDGWKAANQRLKNSRHLDNEDVCEDIYNRLKLSYDYLKGDNIRSCFLLCSLFPEDFDIPIELLIMLGIGYGLFSNIHLMEDLRTEIREALRKLQDSGLLLKNVDDYVSMHDVLRDFAHWITSKGENIFMFKEGLIEWPISDSCGCYTAISFWDSNINTFPDKLKFLKLKILVFAGNNMVRVPIALVEGMDALQVLYLRKVVFSLEVLKFITNLRTLRFEYCELENISSLKNVENLEILVLSDTNIYVLPQELLALRRLKSLHFSSSGQCNFPPNLLSRLTSLQELHVTTENNVDLSELNSLSGLTALSLRVSTDQCVRENFVLHKLQRYNIAVNGDGDFLFLKEPTFRNLKIRDFSTSLSAFKELFCNVEKLALEKVMEHKNIVPNVDEEGLKELTSLDLSYCEDLECLIDTAGEQEAIVAFSNLVELNMRRLTCIKELCHGPPPIRFLQKLKDVIIHYCERLEVVFEMDGILENEEIIQPPLLSNLTSLNLCLLPELGSIWKLQPTHRYHASLQSLKVVTISQCNKLKSIFSTCVVQSLLHLEELNVFLCDELEQVIDFPQEVAELEPTHRYHASLQSLKVVRIGKCDKLKSIFSTSVVQSLLHLENLTVDNCDKLEQVFDFPQEVVELEENQVPPLSNLTFLDLRDLPKLSCIWKGPTHLVNLRSLKFMRITRCLTLAYLFPIPLAQGLVHLEELEIQCCNSLEHLIIEAESNYSSCLSKLRTLQIMSCESLKYVFPITLAQGLVHLEVLQIQCCNSLEHLIIEAESNYSPCLSKLRTLQIMNCESLKYVFPITLAQGLVHLEELMIRFCDSLKHLIIEAESDYSLCWSKLKTLDIMYCESLKYVFPITLAQGLPCLESIEITNSSQLKQIFTMTKENVGRRQQDIVLPRLQILKLDTLENLCSFYPENFVMSLTEFKVCDCPRLTQQIITSLQTYLELKEVRVMNCGQLQEVFQTDDLLHNMEEIQAPLLSNLTSLELESLPELKWIWKGPSHYFCLQRLKVAEIRQCNRLKYLFSPSLAQSLVLLEELVVVECNELEHITTEMEIDGNIESDSGHLHPPLFPKLTSLEIHSCPRLEYVFNVAKEKNGVDHAIALPRLQHLQLENLINLSCVCSENYPFVSPSLQKLTIWDCPRLLHFTIQQEVNKQVQLKELRLSELGHNVCDTINCEKIFQVRDGHFLSRIEALYLNRIHKLRGPIQVASPQYLTKLNVSNCNRLKSLFSYMLVLNLPQLKFLRIELCEELEEIIEIDQTSIASSSQGYLQPISFPSLQSIWIHGCNNLKSLFPISVARSLSNLNSINIQGASKLKQVFGYEGEPNVEDDEKGIVFPKLKKIELLELPSLTSFAPMGYNFPFPSLNQLQVGGCPYQITRFSEDSSGIMNAITEAPRQVEHNTAEGLTTTEEIVDNLPTCNDISWRNLSRRRRRYKRGRNRG